MPKQKILKLKLEKVNFLAKVTQSIYGRAGLESKPSAPFYQIIIFSQIYNRILKSIVLKCSHYLRIQTQKPPDPEPCRALENGRACTPSKEAAATQFQLKVALSLVTRNSFFREASNLRVSMCVYHWADLTNTSLEQFWSLGHQFERMSGIVQVNCFPCWSQLFL